MVRLRRLILTTTLAVLAGCPLLAVPVSTASAATFKVCSGRSYSSIQSALNVAHNGDVIRVGPGTFAGGITILNSVKMIGTGATIIQGGGPVVTTGSADTTSEPTISISGFTITGGSNT